MRIAGRIALALLAASASAANAQTANDWLNAPGVPPFILVPDDAPLDPVPRKPAYPVPADMAGGADRDDLQRIWDSPPAAPPWKVIVQPQEPEWQAARDTGTPAGRSRNMKDYAGLVFNSNSGAVRFAEAVEKAGRSNRATRRALKSAGLNTTSLYRNAPALAKRLRQAGQALRKTGKLLGALDTLSTFSDMADKALEGDYEGAGRVLVHSAASGACSSFFATKGAELGASAGLSCGPAGVAVGGAVGGVSGAFAGSYVYDEYLRRAVDDSLDGFKTLARPLVDASYYSEAERAYYDAVVRGEIAPSAPEPADTKAKVPAPPAPQGKSPEPNKARPVFATRAEAESRCKIMGFDLARPNPNGAGFVCGLSSVRAPEEREIVYGNFNEAKAACARKNEIAIPQPRGRGWICFRKFH